MFHVFQAKTELQIRYFVAGHSTQNECIAKSLTGKIKTNFKLKAKQKNQEEDVDKINKMKLC